MFELNVITIFRIAVTILMVSMLGAIIMLTRCEKKKVIDFYEWFIIGGIWIILGILATDIRLLSLGLIFVGIAYYHKKTWKKNHKANAWEKLNKFQRKIKASLMIMMAILIILGITSYVFLTF